MCGTGSVYRSPIKVKQSVTGLEWDGVLEEVKISRFHDNGTGWG